MSARDRTFEFSSFSGPGSVRAGAVRVFDRDARPSRSSTQRPADRDPGPAPIAALGPRGSLVVLRPPVTDDDYARCP